jgi:GTP cyclohydrolase IB
MNDIAQTADTGAEAIPDVQGSPDDRRIAIEQVGVRGMRHPIQVRGPGGAPLATVARVEMSVSLAHHQKGTHMSRFLAMLNDHQAPLDAAGFRAMAADVTERLDAERARVAFQFPYFRDKTAPVSGLVSKMDYEVEVVAESGPGGDEVRLTVVVPVTTLCPCSKKISDYGAHNQRSHVTVSVRPVGDYWIDDAIRLAESCASAELYGILKRADEKFVTEKAYDNPRFVEDLVREVAAGLDGDERVPEWRVEVENFESIHNHSAWAVVTSETARA